MLILIVAIALVAVGIWIVYLLNRLAKAKGELFAAKREVVHSRARQEAAKQRAKEAQERCMQLVGQLSSSLGNTRQALDIAQHIELVSSQLDTLFEYIGLPAGTESSGRHVPDEPVIDGHVHTNHQLPSQAMISNGFVRYVHGGNS
jgi:hypothetical protein